MFIYVKPHNRSKSYRIQKISHVENNSKKRFDRRAADDPTPSLQQFILITANGVDFCLELGFQQHAVDAEGVERQSYQ